MSKEIVIISGKGGTGKTIITASFASLAKNKVMADTDVDAADLHLLLHPQIKETHEFRSGKTAFLDSSQCNLCEMCLDVCRFDAIKKENENIIVDPISCEGCGVCSHICPQETINMQENTCGEYYISDSQYGPIVHAKLGIAEENSGKLVSEVRKNAKRVAEKENADYIIIDGPPGIGCPVIASITGVNLALIVTEPTLSGMHDLERICKVTKHFQIKTLACINKFDLNISNTERIKTICKKLSVTVVGEIPFDKKVVEALVSGVPVVEHDKSNVGEKIKEIWKRIARSSKGARRFYDPKIC